MTKGRWGSVLLGAGLVLVSILGFYILSRLASPPSQEVFTALRELHRGERLSPEMVAIQLVQMHDPSAYVQASEIETYGFHALVEDVHQGEFIPKAAISMESNPYVGSRVALGLDDPDKVAMVIPVDPSTAPASIVAGDRVDVTISIGSASFLSGSFAAAPSPAPSGGSSPALAFPTVENPLITAQPSPTLELSIDLPISKTLLTGARVLAVEYQQDFNPAFSAQGSEPGLVNGDLRAIVVAIPRQLQEALAFAINNGDVRVAVADPNALSQDALTPGISWNDLVAYYKAQLHLFLLTPQPGNASLIPSGADALAKTVVATYLPSPTLTPSRPSASPTPEATQLTGTPQP